MTNEYQRHSFKGSTVPGVTSAQTCREGDYYRWIIRTPISTYVDGGNYRDREAAIAGLREALGIVPHTGRFSPSVDKLYV